MHPDNIPNLSCPCELLAKINALKTCPQQLVGGGKTPKTCSHIDTHLRTALWPHTQKCLLMCFAQQSAPETCHYLGWIFRLLRLSTANQKSRPQHFLLCFFRCTKVFFGIQKTKVKFLGHQSLFGVNGELINCKICSWHFGRSKTARVGFNGRRPKKAAAKAAESSSTNNRKS